MTRLFALLLACLLPAMAAAQSYDDVIQAELRPGWRLPNGDHMAALHMRLAPGWKTYWRAPGESGIPPVFSWSQARNADSVDIQWPAPHVFWQSGMRSVGYTGDVVLPLRITPKKSGKDMRLEGMVDIGICKDVCMPHRVHIDAVLPAAQKRPDASIAAALADIPFSKSEAGIRKVQCSVTPGKDGLTLEVSIDMPKGTGREETVIEFHDPMVHIMDPKTRWSGNRLVAKTWMTHLEGGTFAMNRSGVRITVLGGRMPIDIQGCTG